MPDKLEVRLTMGGVEQPPVFYDSSSVGAGEKLRLNLLADASSLSEGRHKYTVEVIEHRGTEKTSRQIPGERDLLNKADSELGDRWSYSFLDKLVPGDGGMAVLRGSDSAAWYSEKGTTGDYRTAPSNFDKLIRNGDNTYTLTDHYGNRDEFNSDGLLVSRFDSNGNESVYSYIDADGDSLVDEISSITDPFGRSISFAYSGGFLQTVTDYAGRTTTLTHDANGRLESVTRPDPDGAGPDPAPVRTFAYDANGVLDEYRDARNNLTTVDTNFARRFDSMTHPDGTSWSMTAVQLVGLVDSSVPGGIGTTLSNPAPVKRADTDAVTVLTNERGFTTTMTTDRYGELTSLLDALGNFYQWDRDFDGRVKTFTEPAGAGGDSPLPALATDFTYDDCNNITRIDYADGSFEEWTYDPTFSRVTSHADEIGRVTLYDIDPANGNVLNMTRVFGLEVDSEIGSMETDDISWSFTYTDGLGVLPSGLLLTETDPLDRVTTYEYYDDSQADDFGWLESITFADGTADEATASFEYDAAGNIEAVIDELDHRTEYDFDNLDRLKEIREPAAEHLLPNGTPATFSAITQFKYDAEDNLTFVHEYLDQFKSVRNTTEYVYDVRNRLIQIIEEDPTVQGGNNNPVTEFTYDGTSNLSSVTDPIGRTVTYVYDELDRLVETVYENPTPNDIAGVDNSDTNYGETGSGWTTVSDTEAVNGDYRQASPGGGDTATWTFDNLIPGQSYDVKASWVADAGNATDAPFTISHGVITEPVVDVDQTQDLSAQGITHFTIGSFTITSDTLTVTLTDDADGNVVADQIILLAAAPIVAMTYDSVGNVSSSTDRLGNKTRYRYDERHRLVEITEEDPESQGATNSPVTTYQYDAASQLLSVSDPLGRTISYVYDELGRLTKETLPDADGDSQTTGDTPVTIYLYDKASNLVSMTDPEGNVTDYEYDNRDRLFKVIDADPGPSATHGRPETEYVYDDANRLTKIIDPLDRETDFQYDDADRLTHEIYADVDGNPATTGDRPTMVYTYDAVGNEVSMADPLGNVTSYEYDNLYRLIRQLDEDPDVQGGTNNPETTFSYDVASQLLNMTDPLGRVTSYEYDGLGRLEKETQPDPTLGIPGPNSPSTTYVYDLANNLLSSSNALGHTDNYAYDNLYRRNSQTDANGDVTTLSFDLVDNLLALTDPATTSNPTGNTTTFFYDGLDRVKEERNHVGDSRFYTYDFVGNRVSMTDRNGRVTDYQYDNLYRQTAEQWREGSNVNISDAVISIDVSQAGVGVAQDYFVNFTDFIASAGEGADFTDLGAIGIWGSMGANSNDVSIDYVRAVDGQTGQLVIDDFDSGTANINLTTAMEFVDHTEELAAVLGGERDLEVDQFNAGTTHVRLDAGKFKSTNTADWSQFTLSYDGIDGDANWKDLDGLRVDLTQGGQLDRFVVNVAADEDFDLYLYAASGQTVTRQFDFTYDLADQMLSAGEAEANYTYVYDDLGRVTRITDTVLVGVQQVDSYFDQQFDLLGNRTQLAYSDGLIADFAYDATYDNLYRTTQIDLHGVVGGNALADKRVDFAYDIASQPDSITRYADLAGMETAVVSDFSYDLTGRLTDLTHTAPGEGILADYDYVFDMANRITQFVSSADGTVDYNYDDRNQITGADYDYQTDEDYLYDENGNRLTGNGQSYTTGNLNQLDSDGVYNYEHDKEGNRTRRTHIANGTVTVYKWDHRNRLVEIIDYANTVDADAEVNSTKYVEHKYDVYNRWIRRTVDADGAGTGATSDITTFLYDGNQIIIERNLTTNDYHRYLWGPVVDQILADEVVAAGATEGDVIWTLTDNLGTVRDLAQYDDVTDTTTVVNHITYDSFGNKTSETATVDHLFGYTGRAFDEETGLQNNLNRWYDPEVGRWISKDPIGFAAGDANFYRYVGNSPTLYVDPDGLEAAWYEFWKGEWWTGGDHTAAQQGTGRRRMALIEGGGQEANRQLQASVKFAGELPGAVLTHAQHCAFEAVLLGIPGPADDAAVRAYRGKQAADAVVDYSSSLRRILGAPWKNLKQLREYLKRQGIGLMTDADKYLKPGQNAAFAIREGGPVILLRANPTKREVLHEVGHALTYLHLGDDAYKSLSKPCREHLASTFVRSRDAFKKMNPEEVWQEMKQIIPDFKPTEELIELLKKWGVYNG